MRCASAVPKTVLERETVCARVRQDTGTETARNEGVGLRASFCKGPPASRVPLRGAVCTGDTRDARPNADMNALASSHVAGKENRFELAGAKSEEGAHSAHL